MAVPQGKTSKSRTRSRRAHHDIIKPRNLGTCDACGEPKLPHTVCLSCGTYKGRQLIRVVES